MISYIEYGLYTMTILSYKLQPFHNQWVGILPVEERFIPITQIRFHGSKLSQFFLFVVLNQPCVDVFIIRVIISTYYRQIIWYNMNSWYVWNLAAYMYAIPTTSNQLIWHPIIVYLFSMVSIDRKITKSVK